jgi:2-polyprenyl-3-methyl-5-hydroxy-6-metoxy-1,4-benzoquinol methylase
MSADYFSNPRHDVVDILEGHYETVLDVGCGSGAFGSLLKNRGKAIRVVGIDAYEPALVQASLCLDLAILHDLSNGLPELDEKFDLISLNDVLEHLIAPEKVLIAAHGMLKKDGIIVCSLPNIRNHKILRKLLFAGDWTYTKEGILDVTHLRFYTFKSAENLLRDCGYSVISSSGSGQSKVPCALRLMSYFFCHRRLELRYQQFIFKARSRVNA